MDSQQQQIDQIAARIIEAQREITDLEKEANALEHEARAKRSRRSDLKREVSELTTVLGHKQVAKRVADNEAETRAALERAKAKEAELDELLAKAKAASEPKE